MSSRKITIIRERDEKEPKSSKSKSDDGKKIDDEKVEKSLISKLIDSDDVTLALDVVSAIGVGTEALGTLLSWTGIGAGAAAVAAGIGAAADITNALRMAARGDLFKAGLYAIFAVPVFGDFLQGAKIAGLAGEGGVKIIAKLIKIAKTEKGLKAAATASKIIDKVPGNESDKHAVKGAVKIFMSGDVTKIANLAEKSGDKDMADAIRNELSKENPDEADSEELSESRASRSLRPLYKRSLYS